MNGHVEAIIFGAIRRTEAQLAAALAALNSGQTEEARAQLQGALLCQSELANTLGRN